MLIKHWILAFPQPLKKNLSKTSSSVYLGRTNHHIYFPRTWITEMPGRQELQSHSLWLPGHWPGTAGLCCLFMHFIRSKNTQILLRSDTAGMFLHTSNMIKQCKMLKLKLNLKISSVIGKPEKLFILIVSFFDSMS